MLSGRGFAAKPCCRTGCAAPRFGVSLSQENPWKSAVYRLKLMFKAARFPKKYQDFSCVLRKKYDLCVAPMACSMRRGSDLRTCRYTGVGPVVSGVSKNAVGEPTDAAVMGAVGCGRPPGHPRQDQRRRRTSARPPSALASSGRAGASGTGATKAIPSAKAPTANSALSPARRLKLSVTVVL